MPIVAGWAADLGNAPPAMQQLLLLGYGFVLSMLSVKNPYFRDEREWRLDRVILPALAEAQTRVRTLRGVDTPYEQIVLIDKVTGETPIVEVVLGPRARSDESVAEVRGVLTGTVSNPCQSGSRWRHSEITVWGGQNSSCRHLL